MANPTEQPLGAFSESARRQAAAALPKPKWMFDLQNAIRDQYGSESNYCRTVLVQEKVDAGMQWDGFVKVFDLLDNPAAQCCYAWSYQEGGEQKFITMANIPPIDSPGSAVRAFSVGCATH